MQPHLILAEDEFLAALALEDFLSSRGYRVSPAADGAEALAMYEKSGADALLTDWRMPKLDGGELVRRVRAIDPELPVVVISGHVHGGDGLGAEVGGEPPVYLPKPINLNSLASALAKLLPRRS